MRRFGALFLVSSLLWGCVTKLPVLPPVPREPIDRLREVVTAMTKEPSGESLPSPLISEHPPADLECSQVGDEPTLWLCVGDPERMGNGAGLFFSYQGGAADDLRKILASERMLRELVGVLKSRLEVRDRMLLAQLDLLTTMLAMADEYRLIAIVRGEEIERLQRDRIIDRFTMVLPVVGIGAGIVYLLIR